MTGMKESTEPRWRNGVSGARRGPKRVRMGKRGLLILELVTPLLLIALWWSVSASSTEVFFPPLQAIVVEFADLWLFEHFVSDVIPSMINLVTGFLLASVIGIALGAALGLIRPMRWLLEPVIQFWRAIPAVALLPLFIALLGFGNEVRLFVITLAALFPVLISTIDGIRSVEPQLLDVSRVFHLTKTQRLLQVYLPAAGPQIASGMQVSLQVAFIVMISSEMMGSTHGIGAMTMTAQKSFDILGMWAGILLLGIIGYIVNFLFARVRNWALAWFIGAQRSMADG